MCASTMIRAEEGSAAVATVGVIASIVLVLSLFIMGGAALLEFVSVHSALSEATLSAAEAVTGEREGYPCTLASERAREANAASVSCQVRGHHVRVVWRISVMGFGTELRAQAGVD